MKVLGIRAVGIRWHEIEILTGDDGRSSVKLYGQALDKAVEINLKEVFVSLSSDSKQNTIAVAVRV